MSRTKRAIIRIWKQEIALDSGARLPARRFAAVGVEEAPVFVMAHGAGAGQAHPFMRRVAEGLSARGITVVTFDFAYMAAARRVPDRMPLLEAALLAAIRWARAGDEEAGVLIGGKSMGGRVASRVAADRLEEAGPLEGLILFGYPLHPPGRPEELRVEHLPRLRVPTLVVQGTRDPFGSPEELQPWLRQVPAPVVLHAVEDGDHSLGVPRRSDPKGLRFTTALDAVSTWAQATAR
jgi:uncharacterized protein